MEETKPQDNTGLIAGMVVLFAALVVGVILIILYTYSEGDALFSSSLPPPTPIPNSCLGLPPWPIKFDQWYLSVVFIFHKNKL